MAAASWAVAPARSPARRGASLRGCAARGRGRPWVAAERWGPGGGSSRVEQSERCTSTATYFRAALQSRGASRAWNCACGGICLSTCSDISRVTTSFVLHPTRNKDSQFKFKNLPSATPRTCRGSGVSCPGSRPRKLTGVVERTIHQSRNGGANKRQTQSLKTRVTATEN